MSFYRSYLSSTWDQTFFHALIFFALGTATASALEVQVEITNNAPVGGVAVTPVWVGFHDGSFDSYNGGLSSQMGLERLAEDGDTSLISSDFLGGYTYIDNSSGTPTSARILSSQPGAERVDGTIGSVSGPPPIQPGETASQSFTVNEDGSHRYFSYAAMVIPSGDFFVANGNPLAVDLSPLYGGSGTISFVIGLPDQVNDAGTEINDFDTSAGNGLFGLPGGQTGPNEGADENGVVTNVVGDPFNGFLNPPAANLDAFNFNDAVLYPNGVATITITAVPEPATFGFAGIALGLPLLRRVRRHVRVRRVEAGAID